MIVAGVAVDKATLDFDKIFSYAVPENLRRDLKVGSIVLVPFGKGDKLRIGIVLQADFNRRRDEKLKYVADLKNADSRITPYTLSLIKHLKETTFCTWYEAVKAVIPYGGLYKIKGGFLSRQLTEYKTKYYGANPDCDRSIVKTEKQKAVYNAVKEGYLTEKELCRAAGVSGRVIKTLEEKGALIVKTRDRHTVAYNHIQKCRDRVELSGEQQKVFEEIETCTDNKTHLLYGVTSSGKSMVFIKLIQNVLRRGGGAMVLVPEISLTPQMIRLMREYFGDTVSVIHSKLTDTERLLQYNLILKGQSKVVVGTRSAVFAPVENLKLIIIDEEHERSFKSENSPRYSAIRVAQFIAKTHGAKLVLSSATPSVESYFLAQKGFYHLHKLEQRYAQLPLPSVEIIDMSQQRLVGDTGPVSNVVLRYLAENKAAEKQSIVLINRRGYQTIGICKECKEPLKCLDCSVNLVKHKRQNRLMCHYCGRVYPIIDRCPKCGGEIIYGGFGTQHIEEYIQNAIPIAKILRMDADTTQKIGVHEEMLAAFGRKEYDILIGTQMVAKGLDFEDVNLVCVFGADAMLNYPGYSAGEQAFDLITQVIGRAGRRSRGAKAVIQTFDGQNPVLNLAAKQDYPDFYSGEIAYRKLNMYPPFCTLITVAFTHYNRAVCAKDAKTYLDIIKKMSTPEIPLICLGPVPFDVEMVNKNYRWRLSIKCRNNQRFRDFLNGVTERYLKDKNNKSSVYINVNPMTE